MSASMINLFVNALGETLLMVLTSTFLATLLGVTLGILLHVTKPTQILAYPVGHHLLEVILNIGRSIPFIILMVALIPLTRFLVGTSIGTVAAIVPLTIGAIPFMARLIEGVLMEIPSGLMEMACSLGLTSRQIITKILIPEALPGIINSITVTMIALVNYSAMAGAIGAGGLGDIGIRYGYQRFDTTVMLATIVILVILVQLIQSVGNFLIKQYDHR
ncbi:MAG: ABC transporter permease [Chthoniobacterales bacterium]|nr:ABC transporter permease [Chthoniobacterales bacterium]